MNEHVGNAINYSSPSGDVDRRNREDAHIMRVKNCLFELPSLLFLFRIALLATSFFLISDVVDNLESRLVEKSIEKRLPIHYGSLNRCFVDLYCS